MAELIWDGKYDEHGHKRAPVRIVKVIDILGNDTTKTLTIEIK